MTQLFSGYQPFTLSGEAAQQQNQQSPYATPQPSSYALGGNPYGQGSSGYSLGGSPYAVGSAIPGQGTTGGLASLDPALLAAMGGNYLFAGGGVVSRPSVAVVGEGDAPEFVIPMDPKHRKRALALWYAAGKKLGIKGMQAGGMLGTAPGQQTYGGISTGGTPGLGNPMGYAYNSGPASLHGGGNVDPGLGNFNASAYMSQEGNPWAHVPAMSQQQQVTHGLTGGLNPMAGTYGAPSPMAGAPPSMYPRPGSLPGMGAPAGLGTAAAPPVSPQASVPQLQGPGPQTGAMSRSLHYGGGGVPVSNPYMGGNMTLGAGPTQVTASGGPLYGATGGGGYQASPVSLNSQHPYAASPGAGGSPWASAQQAALASPTATFYTPSPGGQGPPGSPTGPMGLRPHGIAIRPSAWSGYLNLLGHDPWTRHMASGGVMNPPSLVQGQANLGTPGGGALFSVPSAAPGARPGVDPHGIQATATAASPSGIGQPASASGPGFTPVPLQQTLAGAVSPVTPNPSGQGGVIPNYSNLPGSLTFPNNSGGGIAAGINALGGAIGQNLGGLAAGYNQAYTDYLGVNQQNYNNIIGGFQQLLSGQSQAQNQLQGQYGNLASQLASGYGGVAGNIASILGQGGTGWGIAGPAAQAIANVYAQQMGAADQGTIDRGLGNSTVLNSVERGPSLDAAKAYGALGANLAGTYAGYAANEGNAALAAQQGIGTAGLAAAQQNINANTALGQSQLAFQNSVNAPPPNAAAYSGLAGQVGQAAQAQQSLAQAQQQFAAQNQLQAASLAQQGALGAGGIAAQQQGNLLNALGRPNLGGGGPALPPAAAGGGQGGGVGGVGGNPFAIQGGGQGQAGAGPMQVNQIPNQNVQWGWLPNGQWGPGGDPNNPPGQLQGNQLPVALGDKQIGDNIPAFGGGGPFGPQAQGQPVNQLQWIPGVGWQLPGLTGTTAVGGAPGAASGGILTQTGLKQLGKPGYMKRGKPKRQNLAQRYAGGRHGK